MVSIAELLGALFVAWCAWMLIARFASREKPTHDATTIFIKCPTCGRRAGWERSWLTRIIVTKDRAKAIEWFNRGVRCACFVQAEMKDAGFEHPGLESAEFGCGAKMTAAIMEHPLIVELLERKAVADAAHEEIAKEAAPAPVKAAS